MALTAQAIADKAALLLQDTTNIRWSSDEMVKWINAGCKELVLLKPNSLTANISVKLSSGTKQTLSSTAGNYVPQPAAIAPIQLLEVVRNMGTTGLETAAGNAITGIDRKVLDITLPGWHSSANAGTTVKHFMFDPKDPKTFYVYPPMSDATRYVEVILSRAPSAITAIGETLDSGIDEIYENALVDYVLYRAYSKDSEFTANAQRSQWHYQAFQQALGVKLRNEVSMAPDQQFSAPQQQAPQQQG